jgi:flavodoxin
MVTVLVSFAVQRSTQHLYPGAAGPSGMKSLVVHYSRGGKTRKVAEAIARELECEAIDAGKGEPDISGVDLLLVGSGNYGGKPHHSIQSFIDGLKPTEKAKAAVFATSGGPRPKGIDTMKQGLEAKGYEAIASFDCRGQFMLMNRGHPDQDDLENARAFAAELRAKLQD